jgi:hypothetical protein
MSTLPAGFAKLIVPFACLFSKRVFQSAQVLLAGAILAPGKRTVTSVLRIMGLTLPDLSPSAQSRRMVELSDRTRAKITRLPRATPGDFITHTSAIDSLCGLAPRPATLDQFLEVSILPRQQQESIAIANAH